MVECGNVLFFFFNDTATTEIYTLSLHDALPIYPTTYISRTAMSKNVMQVIIWGIWLLISLSIFHVNNSWLVVVSGGLRSEEHTSELQSRQSRMPSSA